MPAASLPVDGSCLCGGVRFRVSGPFITVLYCHCTHCQKRTGTGASVQGRVAQDDFELLAGAELLKAFAPTATSRPKVFCRECGSHLFSGEPLTDAEVSIRLGVFDGPIDAVPESHIFVRSAPPWAPVPDDGLAHYETVPNDEIGDSDSAPADEPTRQPGGRFAALPGNPPPGPPDRA